MPSALVRSRRALFGQRSAAVGWRSALFGQWPDANIPRVARPQRQAHGQPFERPEDFDLATHWAESIMSYEGTRPKYEAVFRCRPEDVERIGDIVGMRRLGESSVEPDPGDSSLVRVRLAFDWIDQAQAAAFGLGHVVEVLEPPELRDQLVKVARTVLSRYEPSPERLATGAPALA